MVGPLSGRSIFSTWEVFSSSYGAASRLDDPRVTHHFVIGLLQRQRIPVDSQILSGGNHTADLEPDSGNEQMRGFKYPM